MRTSAAAERRIPGRIAPLFVYSTQEEEVITVNRSTWQRLGRTLFIAVGMLTIQTVTEARVTRVEITRVESPTFEGRSFGKAGQYEKLVGVAYGEVDPTDPFNTGIVNLDRTPRN